MSTTSHLYIPFADFQGIGGPSTFMRNLCDYLHRHGVDYQEQPHNAHVIFFPVLFALDVIQKIKQQGGYVIQRLDGIYYPSKHGECYLDLNRDIQTIYENYADCVIFQSCYSQAQCSSMFRQHAHAQIILNGVNKHIFYPAPHVERIVSRPIRLISTGNFRNIDMLEPVIRALDVLEGVFQFELVLVGPITNKKLETFLQRDYIQWMGEKDLAEVAALLRKSDLFLYSHLNPPCPNSVIEAISCGLPVVGFDSGAMSELCFFSKELLAYVSEDIFQKYEDFDFRKLAEKIVLAVERYDDYKARAMQYSHLYSFEECGRQYVAVFERYLKKRRKLLSLLTYQATEKLSMFTHVRGVIKSYLIQWLVLAQRSPIRWVLMRLNQQHFTDLFALVMRQKFDSEGVANVLLAMAKQHASALSPEDALRFLLMLDNKLYGLEGQASVRYGNGLHTKHRHIKYHDFFVQRIESGSRVLDVGCGNGALAYDIATQVAGVSVYGIDIVPTNVECARRVYAAENIEYVCGDALVELPEQTFEVIVLSNVLEHIEKRVDFLRGLQRKYQPNKFLIRVPMFERDWRIPLQAELGMDYRLDATHFIEYRQEEFRQELTQAGLRIMYAQINWGEIWAEASAI